ncbi:MAG: DUF87 domain-containing protein [Candidatus Korarchaeota archaeon NZ13-K]|nr:MAG: DUF87 domain-containing protein [Candidatus Korarchaeota archaeon NZ13-K]
MRLIGRVADDSGEVSASVILLKGLEREVTSESLVLIENAGSGSRVLGILRRGRGRNEFLRRSGYRPEVAYLRHGGEPSSSREVYSFDIIVLGCLEGGKLRANRMIIAPGSPVYLFDEENPLELIAGSAKRLAWMRAHLEGRNDWRVPADAQYIPYHVGVFGSTGTGKSWFTRHVLIPFYIDNGYRVIVLDWSGEDYAPYLPSVRLSELALDELSILQYLSGLTDDFAGNNSLRNAFDDYVSGWVERVRGRDEVELYEDLREFVQRAVRGIRRDDWRESAERALSRVFRRLSPGDLAPLMGTRPVSEIVESGERLIAVDMSGFSNEIKLGFFLTLASELKRRMVAGQDLGIALVIDEAPQYCPHRPEGIQAQVTEEIKNLAALGRKHDLNLTLVAQGVAGEIGINAAIRRNLNTNFYGRLHPLDAAGEGSARDWLGPYGITPEYLLTLEDGRFYFTGAMNPSPVPLLITFEVEGLGGTG